MAGPLDRTWFDTLVDDSGSNTDGTIWNKAAVDALMDAVDVSLATITGEILNRDVTEAEVVNTVTETTVYTTSITANTFGTTRAVRLTLLGTYLNNSGSPVDLQVKVTFGGTTIAGTATVTGWGTDASRRAFLLVSVISAANATNAQRAITVYRAQTAADGDVAGAWGGISQGMACHDALAIDTTGAVTLAVTITHGTAATTISFKCVAVQLELL